LNPGGTIELKAGDDGKANGGAIKFSALGGPAAASFAALKELIVGKGASFVSVDTASADIDSITFAGLTNLEVYGTVRVTGNNITFPALTKLKVDGSLTIPSTGLAFTNLQNQVGSKTDVRGTGKAVFAGWDVANASHGHAFDQILGIKDVTVRSVTGVPKTSGSTDLNTPDRAVTNEAGYKLTVNTITAITSGNLTIDRDLYVTAGGSITGTTANTITLAPGASVYANDGLVMRGTGSVDAVLAPVVGSTAVIALAAPISPAKGTLYTNTSTPPFTLKSGVLEIPGTLQIVATGRFDAGTGTAVVSLANHTSDTYLKNVIVSSVAADPAITVRGTLSIGAAATVAAGARIRVEAGGEILTGGTAGATLTNASTVLAINSRLKATVAGDIANLSDAAATPATTVSKISGEFTLSATGTGGTLTFTGANSGTDITGSLDLSNGKITVTNGDSEYDTAALERARISAPAAATVTFNGSTGIIALGAASVNVAGGALTTFGTGALQFGTIATLQTKSIPQPLPALMTGNGILNGDLVLAEASVLTINTGIFAVGGGTTAGGDARLDVTKGEVKLNSNAASITIGNGPTTALGLFTNGGFRIQGVTAGGYAGITGVAPDPTVTLESTDLSGSVTATPVNDPTLVGTSARVTPNAGDITIAGSSGGNSITNTSELYSLQ
jgi:hypothetical protein